MEWANHVSCGTSEGGQKYEVGRKSSTWERRKRDSVEAWYKIRNQDEGYKMLMLKRTKSGRVQQTSC